MSKTKTTNNTPMNFFKNKKNRVITIIAAVLVSVLSLGAIGGATGILKFDKDTAADKLLPGVHPDNFYASAEITLESGNDGNGVTVDVNERTGVVTLDGKAEADLTYVVGTVVLNEGTYTFTALENASKNTVCVKATVYDVDHYFDFTGNTFEIEADETEVTITICVKAGTELNNVKVLPTIVEGEEAGKFYK